ncbi:MAG: efflux RND transporter periplasmic adaptor subunit [Vicinamibacteria bacterium]|nr:efflux RND transporter periplasmic adaptor subunit [Vicinamibacteria bacterium]
MNRRAASAFGVAALVVAGLAAGRAARGSDVVLHTVERGVLRNEILATGIVDAVRKTPISVPQDLSNAMRVSWLRAAGPVKAGDVVLSFDPADMEKDALDSRSDSASASSKLDKARAEGTSKERGLDLDFTVTTDELSRARDIAPEDTRIFSRNQIIEGQLDRGVLEQRLTVTSEKKQATHKLTGVDMDLAAIERRKAELKLKRAEKGLSAMRVLAPHDGILVFPMNWRGEVLNIGDTAWPGQTIAEIPDLSQLQARVFVLEGDAFGLAAGNRARIEVDGQPGLAYEAKVKRVDTLAKPRERGSPVKYFETWLDFPADAFRNVKPGRRVRASILLTEVDDALWVPKGALFQKDGRRYVLKSEGGALREADVTVGASSLGRIQVLTGLAAGDRVALSDPRQARPGTSGGGENTGAAPAAASAGR